VATTQRREYGALGKPGRLNSTVEVRCDRIATTRTGGPTTRCLTSEHLDRGFSVLLFDGVVDVLVAHEMSSDQVVVSRNRRGRSSPRACPASRRAQNGRFVRELHD